MTQGVIFCNTVGYPVGKAATDYIEVALTANYPTTPTSGTATSVGWSALGPLPDSRDRDNTNVAALCGLAFDGVPNASTYTILLPANTYPIRIAMGDANVAQSCHLEVFDDATSRGVLINATTSAAQRFFDATGTEYTNATWTGGNTAVNIICNSGLMRFRRGSNNTISPLCYIEIGNSAINNAVFYLRA